MLSSRCEILPTMPLFLDAECLEEQSTQPFDGQRWNPTGLQGQSDIESPSQSDQSDDTDVSECRQQQEDDVDSREQRRLSKQLETIDLNAVVPRDVFDEFNTRWPKGWVTALWNYNQWKISDPTTFNLVAMQWCSHEDVDGGRTDGSFSTGLTAIHNAAIRGLSLVLKYMLGHGGLEDEDRLGRSALWYAVNNADSISHLDCVKQLLRFHTEYRLDFQYYEHMVFGRTLVPPNTFHIRSSLQPISCRNLLARKMGDWDNSHEYSALQLVAEWEDIIQKRRKLRLEIERSSDHEQLIGELEALLSNLIYPHTL